MFSPERYGLGKKSFGTGKDHFSKPYVSYKTAFKPKGLKRSKSVHFCLPADPAPIIKDRGFRPSDLTDPGKKDYLTSLTNRVFHLDLDGEGEHETIPLERLFTPASDANDIAALKKKKLYSSSSFYLSDHPTIKDQVELAHKISVSLVDEMNKQSKGQSMYMKRKSKSSTWIHAGQWDGTEESPPKESKEPPPLKLLLNPKGIHDYQSIQNEQYDEYSTSNSNYQRQKSGVAGTGNEISSSEIQSPIGKGAALFAKRKARMDKYIVDETTVQKSTKTYNKPGPVEKIVQNNAVFLSHSSNTKTNGVLPGNAIYKAEVKIEEKPSILSPDIYDFSSISNSFVLDLQEQSNDEKRKSKTFNLAPKGWGTYTDYYTPIHLSSS